MQDRPRPYFDGQSDFYFIGLAERAASYSPDPKTKVGAVIVNELGRLVVYGFNDFPIKIAQTPERWERPLKYKYVCHAEQSAIYNAASAGRMVGSCSMFIHGLPPCIECVKAIIQSGITRVICPSASSLLPHQQHWIADLGFAQTLLAEAKISVSIY